VEDLDLFSHLLKSCLCRGLVGYSIVDESVSDLCHLQTPSIICRYYADVLMHHVHGPAWSMSENLLIGWTQYKSGECYKYWILAEIIHHSSYEGMENKHLRIYNFDGSVIGEVWLGEGRRWEIILVIFGCLISSLLQNQFIHVIVCIFLSICFRLSLCNTTLPEASIALAIFPCAI